MQRTLYVTDLDGTLLDNDGKVSKGTLEIIKNLIKKGTLFTIATARNLQAVKPLIKEIPINIPMILNNGIAFYDFNKEDYLKINEFPLSKLDELIDVFKKHKIYGFMFALKDKELHLIYKSIEDPADREYFEERYLLYKNYCHQYDDLTKVSKDGYKILYFVVYGSLKRIEQIENDIINIPNVNCVKNKNVYKDNYFLDIFSEKASKAIAISELKNMVNADEVVAFGDNYNDIGMLKAAERSYVPVNGIDEAKKVATDMIESNNEDGVARFIKKDVLRKALNNASSFLAHRHYDDLDSKNLKKHFDCPVADVTIVFGNSIPYTGELAAKIYASGRCKKILFTGGIGHSTSILRENARVNYDLKNIEDKSEAFILKEIAKRNEDIPEEDILIEEKSTNSGENSMFSLKLLGEMGIPHKNIILIQDPLLQLRSYATLKNYLTKEDMNILSFSPFIPFLKEDFKLGNPQEICGMWTFNRYIELIIGEIPRLRDDKQGYGPNGKGYIAHVDIPKEIEESYNLILESFSSLSNRKLN